MGGRTLCFAFVTCSAPEDAVRGIAIARNGWVRASPKSRAIADTAGRACSPPVEEDLNRELDFGEEVTMSGPSCFADTGDPTCWSAGNLRLLCIGAKRVPVSNLLFRRESHAVVKRDVLPERAVFLALEMLPKSRWRAGGSFEHEREPPD